MVRMHTLGGEVESPTSERDRLLELATALPEVVNGLLTAEHAAYDLAWNRVLKDRGGIKGPVAYSGIGPDLVTVSQVTNFQELIGIDIVPVTREGLERQLGLWDTVDSDIVPEDTRTDMVSNYVGDKPTYEQLIKTQQSILGSRRREGYWRSTDRAILGIEKCIVIELKKMGVNPDTISVSEGNGHTRLEYECGIPGEDPQTRLVTYIQGSTLQVFRGETDTTLPQIGCYYQKSNDSRQDLWVLEHVPHYLVDGGFIVLSREGNISCSTELVIMQNKDTLRTSFPKITFTPFSVNPVYTEMMRGTEAPDEYGWLLYGFKKN